MMKRDSSSNNLKKLSETISESLKILRLKTIKSLKKDKRSESKKSEYN